MQPFIGLGIVLGAPVQQWRLPQPIEGDPLACVDLPLPLKAMLFRRGFKDPEQVELLISEQPLPAADQHFCQA